MSDKDEIKELFQKELGNYEAKVDPSLWNGIQSGLSGASAAGGAATGISVVSKVIIGVVIATAATVSSVLIFSKEETTPKTQAQVETSQNNKEELDKSLTLKEVEKPIDVEVEENNVVEESHEVNENVIDDSNIQIRNEEITDSQEQPVILLPKVEEKVDQKQENKTDPLEVENDTPTTEVKEELKPLIADIVIGKQDNQYVRFISNGENIERIDWYFGDGNSSTDLSPEHFYEEPGEYNVIAIIYGENNNKLEKTIKVNVEVEGKFTKLPNAFTPNNDGSNDEFFVESEGIIELQLNIFNKRQELIFSTNDINFKWRGLDLKGQRVPDGEYVYVIIAKDKAGNTINKYKTLTITR